ncbi:MAG: tyrosine-type recombinase/integrase [Woeseiaceae bacterium]|nr:tyrosine-type recombinase/integrase [Woeseiaceae bacterium]
MAIEDKTVADLLQDWFDQNCRVWRRPEQMDGYIRRLTADDPHLVAMNIHLVDLVTVRRSLKKCALKQALPRQSAYGDPEAGLQARSTDSISFGTPLFRKSPARLWWCRIRPPTRAVQMPRFDCCWRADRHTDLLRFLLLTGQRIRETQIARWADIDGNRWFIPAAEHKSARDHWVALSRQTLDILDSLAPKRGKVFDSGTPTAVQAFLNRWCVRNKIGLQNQEQRHHGHFTPHDLRRTFATRLNEMKSVRISLKRSSITDCRG